MAKKLKPLRWLEIIVGYTVLTLLVIYFVPSDSALAFLRVVLSFVFIAFLPGYCLVNILFLGKNKLDIVEEVVLSVALSFAIAGLVGLFLGLSPIRMEFVPMTVSLSAIVLILAAVAFVRKIRVLPSSQVKGSEQVST